MSRVETILCCSLAVLASCANLERQPALLMEGTGSHSLPVTTRVPKAQIYFDQGLILAYGFNHDESVRSFAEAARLDPACAMAWWGQAYSLGPNMNAGMDEKRAQKASAAIRRALALAKGASELEQDLIRALAVRLEAPVHEDRAVIEAAYSGAMRALWRNYSDNADVGFLYADALIGETPWELWSPEFEPNFNTREALAVLERVLELDPDHPGANHFTIHAWEASGEPQRAEAAADRLGGITPGLGHMVHMPSHIYVQVGRYADAVRCNEAGARLDREYFQRAGPQGNYYGYQAHNSHFRIWSAMYMGAYEEALDACRILLEDLPDEMKAGPEASSWVGVEQTVHLRFGNWQAALDAPCPRQEQPYAIALWHYARGLAFANLKRFSEAHAEAALFEEVAGALPNENMEFFDASQQVMNIAREMLAGEIAYLSGNPELGFEHLRLSVAAEDALHYSEPSPWMVPTRHALGALLLEQGQVAEAEVVYRADLDRHPGNVWSLQGLTECLERTGQEEAAALVRAQFAAACAQASVEVRASCYCRSQDA